MKFEGILKEIGEFGRYQKLQLFLAALPAIVVGLQNLASVFTSATQDYRCILPEFVLNGSSELEVYSKFNYTDLNVKQEAEAQTSIISNYLGKSNLTKVTRCDTVNVNGDIEKCQVFLFSTEVFQSTIVSEWTLICDDKFLATLSTMIYMGGKLAGAFIFGFVADAIGRKKTMLICVALQGITGIVSAFSINFIMHCIMRFLVATFTTGMYMCCFVLGMEMVGPSYRVLAGIGINYVWAFGYLCLTVFAYLIRWWNWLTLAISIPSFFFLTYYWLIPESARWLITRNRTAEAEKIIQHAAKVNRVTLPDKFLSGLQEEPVVGESLMALCKAKTLLTRTAICLMNWFAVAMGYYGLSLNSGSLGGSIYINFMTSGAIEFVAYSLCFLCVRVGRKRPHIAGMLVGGLACLVSIPVDIYTKDHSDSARNVYFVTLNTIGKLGISMGFCIIYFWSAEIYPTSARNGLMGISSTVGRVGQILAPLIADLGNYLPDQYSRAVSSGIFGGLVIISGLMALGLPETKGYSMPDTISDADIFPSNSDEINQQAEFSKTDQVAETKLQ